MLTITALIAAPGMRGVDGGLLTIVWTTCTLVLTAAAAIVRYDASSIRAWARAATGSCLLATAVTYLFTRGWPTDVAAIGVELAVGIGGTALFIVTVRPSALRALSKPNT